jgi:hypothetical protein
VTPFNEADHRIVTIGVIGMEHPIGANGAKNGEIIIGIGDGGAEHGGCKPYRPRHILDQQIDADARPDRSSEGGRGHPGRLIGGAFLHGLLRLSRAGNPARLG